MGTGLLEEDYLIAEAPDFAVEIVALGLETAKVLLAVADLQRGGQRTDSRAGERGERYENVGKEEMGGNWSDSWVNQMDDMIHANHK